jgi:uncharacterized repeat protein (TIGR04076 family)
MPEYNVKITVVKNIDPEDIFGEKFYRPSGKEIVSCGFKEGDSCLVTDGNMPEGFCHHAWFGMYPKINFIRYGGEFDDWAGPGVDYVCCPDGIRPVVFKLERVEKEK